MQNHNERLSTVSLLRPLISFVYGSGTSEYSDSTKDVFNDSLIATDSFHTVEHENFVRIHNLQSRITGVI